MSKQQQKVGVIGLGNMGGAMGANLIKNGFQNVVGFDPAPQCQKNFAAAGGQVLDSVAAVGACCDVIILSLPSVAALEENLDLLIPVARDGTILLETSTFPVMEKIRLNKKLDNTGITMLDAPLSGTGAQAKVGDLAVFVSGDEEAARKVTDVVDGFSRKQYYLGEFGNGMKMKCVANLMVAIHNQSGAEGMLLGTRYGLPAQLVYDVIADSAGASRMFQVRGPLMVSQQWEPATMANGLFQKDLALISAALEETGVIAPTFEATLPIYEVAAVDHKDGDTAAVYAVLDKMSDSK